MQPFPAIIDDFDLQDMGTKELSARVETLTGRVTALEKKRTPNSSSKGKWDRNVVLSLSSIAVSLIGLPIMLFALLEPHLQKDLKSDVKNEVAEQLKDPLMQIGEIAGDVREIKGKLEILDPLIRQITIQHISESANLDSKELLARLPLLRSVAKIAKTEKVTVKPEAVEKVGKNLIKTGNVNAWETALDFVSYKTFLNASLPAAVNIAGENQVLTTHYIIVRPPGLKPAKFSIVGSVPKEQAAQFNIIGKPDPNADLAMGNDWIIAKDGAITLDNLKMKKVILQNVQVFYGGGPIQLENVYFINCTFSVQQRPNGQHLVDAILEPSPSVTFSAA